MVGAVRTVVIVVPPALSLGRAALGSTAPCQRAARASVVFRRRLRLEAIVVDCRAPDGLRVVPLDALEQKREGIVVGCRDPKLLPLAHEGPVERVDLRSLSLLDVLKGGRLV